MIIDENSLAHYGTPRKSGRYPWGSGGEPYQSSGSFLGAIEEMRRQGMSDTEIAKGMKMSTTDLRAVKTIAIAERKAAQISQAKRLQDKGMSNVAIGKQMGLNESSVRALLKDDAQRKVDVLNSTTNMLRDQVKQKKFVDTGEGVQNQLGISKEKLNTAIAVLKAEGYAVHSVQVPQLGTKNKTTIRVLAPPGTTYRDIVSDLGSVKSIQDYSEDGGLTFSKIKPPIQVNSKRLAIRYADEGGTDADGVIYVRPGVPDLSLGKSRYAQVRIAVDGTHYIKGMAMYRNDLPDGVDLVFNTNKNNTGNKKDALKELQDDPTNPFGSIVRQLKDKPGPDGVPISAMNIVNEEGNWEKWSRNLSSQMLSKQAPSLAKAQLDARHAERVDDLDEIMRLTNPAVKRKLLEEFASNADSAAVHLKAAALPRTAVHVILPMPKMKQTEIYAPNYDDGERVVLIRHPHGGVFEIPELTVNNRNREAKSLLGNARDAVGIHPKVAEKLSGADFDGDTVLVIPNNKGQVKTAPSLAALKNFDPKALYKEYPGMVRMTADGTQKQMGVVSNLITDMTIKGADNEELARAVRHSMVVIDAEKHKLNYKQSYLDNNIAQLQKKYQPNAKGTASGGSSTLISRAGSPLYINARKPRPFRDGGPVDPVTGKKVFVETNESYINKQGKLVVKKDRVKKLEYYDDANILSSGTPIEKVYADYSNKTKALANQARKEALATKPAVWNPVLAKTTYSKEVSRLNSALNVALKNAPLERQAQVLGNANAKARRDANPDMDDAEYKKVKYLALEEARARVGAGKAKIEISPKEWEAIQAGAISNSKLKSILDNADIKVLRTLATPKTAILMTSAKINRARAMEASGYTQAEIASALGVSLSTLKKEL